MTEERCTGHCCMDLSIPYSPDELADAYRRWLAKQRGETVIEMGVEPPKELAAGSIPEEIHLIFPMLRYLGHYPRNPAEAVNPETINQKPVHHYSCKNLDAETHDCTIYPHRPRMCFAYPYGSTCDYAGCTWLKVKTKRISEKEQERFYQLSHPIIDPEPDGLGPVLSRSRLPILMGEEEAIAKPKNKRYVSLG